MLVSNWRAVLARAWSVRFMAFVFLFIPAEPVYNLVAATWFARISTIALFKFPQLAIELVLIWLARLRKVRPHATVWQCIHGERGNARRLQSRNSGDYVRRSDDCAASHVGLPLYRHVSVASQCQWSIPI
jgi:hypothetical protein